MGATWMLTLPATTGPGRSTKIAHIGADPQPHAPAGERIVNNALPGPVPCGRLSAHGGLVSFTYARNYLRRRDGVSLYEPELPLRPGPILPARSEIAGCVADAGPDAWGRRVIEAAACCERGGFSTFGYLLWPRPRPRR